MTEKPKPSLALIAAMTALGMSSLHILVPAVPVVAAAFGDASVRAQLVISLYLAGIAGGQLLYGPLSDRFGRRPVLIAGLTLFLFGTLLCGVAWSLTALIAGRVLQGAGACAGIVLGRAIIRDVYDREAAARGIAIVMMTMTMAPAISPAIGAYLAEWIDWRAIFVLLGAVGAIVLALTMARLPETNTQPIRLDPVGMVASYITLLRLPQFLGFAFCSACASASWFSFCAGAPHVLAETMGRPPSTYGLLILLPMATYMLGNGLTVRFAAHLGTVKMIVIGRSLAFVATAGMLLWYELAGVGVWVLFLPIAVSSIGDGLSQPSVLAAGLSIEPRLAGTASGLIGFLQMAVAAVGTFAVASLPYPVPVSVVAVVAGLAGLAWGFALFALRRPLGDAMPGVPVPQLSREEAA